MLDTGPLRLRDFRHLAAAATINELGNWIGELALAILVFDRTGSALATAALFLSLRFAPALLGPLLTAHAEAFPPRRLLPALYLLEAVLFAALALTPVHTPLSVLLALCALDGTLAIAAGAVTRGATAMTLIDRGLLREGNALLNLGTMAASAVGPVIAGVAVAAWSARAALALDAVSFVLVAAIVVSARTLKLESDTEIDAAGRLRAGLSLIRNHPGLQQMLAGLGLALLFGAIAVPIEVVFAKQTLHAGDTGYGLLLASWGVGQIAGGTVFATASRLRIAYVLVAAAALIAAGYGGLAISPSLAVACAFSCVGGAGNGCGGVAAITALQQAIPMARQSAVMAVVGAVTTVATATGFIVGGAVTAASSPRIAYAISGAGVLLVLAAALLLQLNPRLRRALQDLVPWRRTDRGLDGSATEEPPEQLRTEHAEPNAVMTEPCEDAPAEPVSAAAPRGLHGRDRALLIFDCLALAVAAVVCVLTAHQGNWDLKQLLVIMALTVTSDMIAVELPSSKIGVSGCFLGIVLAAVLLGGAAAALVGTVTILAGWLRWRSAISRFLHNVVAFAWFPLLSGLLFHWVSNVTTVGSDTPQYYLLVFGTFMVALLLNFAIITAYSVVITRSSVGLRPSSLVPIIAPELAAALLMLVAVYLANKGIAGLTLFALVLVVFQYLVGELLVSQSRGEELRLLATTDELTGLLSRKHFEDLLGKEVEAAKRDGQRFGVMLLDLDRFKDINDTLGHQYGDLALVQLAPRIAAMIGERGLVARFGGDEFAVMPARRTDDMELLEEIAAELLACVQEPITVEGITLEMAASIGVSRFPTDGQDGQTLLRRADIAMYVAKERHDGFRLYDPQYDHHSTSRLALLGDFRRALTEDELVVHYHPIVDLKSHEVLGAEGLVRWQHPQHGLLQPGAFLQMVEQTGLIGLLTTRVMELAISDCARWHRDGHKLTVSINLSARNLADPKLTPEVQAMLSRHRLPASALKLEITESMIVTDPERALATLDGLHAMGVRLALDDFGTGFSSLANLRKLPVDELKIDRSFVTPMLEDHSDLAIVRSTIELGHALGLGVTGEGVENAALLARLDELGCDHAQGHYLSVPVPADEFIRWVTVQWQSMLPVR